VQVRAAMGAEYRNGNLGRNRPQLRGFALGYDARKKQCDGAREIGSSSDSAGLF